MPATISLFANLDVLQLITIIALTFLGSLVAALSGAGGGVLVAMAIAPVVGVQALVPTVGVAMLINHIMRVWVYRHEIDWASARLATLIAVPTAVLGSYIYGNLPINAIAIVVGAFLIISIPLRYWLKNRNWQIGRTGLSIGTAIFGVISGATVGGGVIMVSMLLSIGLTKAALIGTDAVIGFAVLIAKAGTFGTLDLLTPKLWLIGIVIGFCTYPGTYLGRWIIERTSVTIHTLFIELLIVVGGISFLWQGFFPEV